jgi:hypothetical protein
MSGHDAVGMDYDVPGHQSILPGVNIHPTNSLVGYK